MKDVFGVHVYLCASCLKSSGHGDFVKITYTNTGGYSPKWEGRLCEHLTVKDIIGE